MAAATPRSHRNCGVTSVVVLLDERVTENDAMVLLDAEGMSAPCAFLGGGVVRVLRRNRGVVLRLDAR